MNTFTAFFITFLFASVGVQIWLALRQKQSVIAHRSQLPDAFSDKIPLDAHQKAADYTVAKINTGFFEIAINMLILLALTFGGGINWLDSAWQGLGLSPLYTGTFFLVSLFIIMGLIELPLSVYSTFVLEKKFGFNRSTARIFIVDHIKQLVLLLLIGVPLSFVVLWLMENMGSLWWLYVWVVWTGFGLLMMWAYPVFIAPLFNKFSPLENGELRDRIEGLLKRCNFTSKGIFVVDGSKRSGHSNAYFTGLGANKRIVFFDTIMKTLNPVEVEAVLAHELGHFTHKHIHKNLLLMFVSSFIGLATLGWVIDKTWFYSGLGVTSQSLHVALTLFLLVLPVFTFFIQPILASVMRKHEYEADDFASKQSDAGALIKALVKLYEENASTLTPDPVYSAFYDSHPPASVRVAYLTSKINH